MLLELSRALSFLASLVCFCWLAMNAFFVPGTTWQERLSLCGFKLGLTVGLFLLSGLLFAWGSPSRLRRGPRFSATLPVRLFFWSIFGLAVLFASSWFLGDLVHDAAPYISDRSQEGR